LRTRDRHKIGGSSALNIDRTSPARILPVSSIDAIASGRSILAVFPVPASSAVLAIATVSPVAPVLPVVSARTLRTFGAVAARHALLADRVRWHDRRRRAVGNVPHNTWHGSQAEADDEREQREQRKRAAAEPESEQPRRSHRVFF